MTLDFSNTFDLTKGVSSGGGTAENVGNGTITIFQGETEKGSFTVNQSGNTTINLDEGGGGTITVDDELSSNSTNPVQNKVINSALGNKLDSSAYVVDSTLNSTSRSPNGNLRMVTSAKDDPESWLSGDIKLAL